MNTTMTLALSTTAGLALVGLTIVSAGCSSIDTTPVASRSAPQLWAENCQRCHNFRALDSLSDSQWKVAMHHMRIRANLTGDEHEKILAFLQAGN